MSTATIVPSVLKQDYRATDLCRKKIYNQNFSYQDLTKLRLRQSLFYQCNFDFSNMTETDCEGSDFFGSSFRQTNCYRTRFIDCKMQCIFEPKDCFGMCISLQCQSFDGMKVSPLWWWAWMTFGLMIHPQTLLGQEDPRDAIIAAIGAERYVKLKGMFSKRAI